jgi:serralysin
MSGNAEQEWYVTPGVDAGFNPFHVSNGILSIQAVIAASQPHTNAHRYPYLSGMIMSDGCFARTYGYFEIRVKVPEGKGLWPALWLLPTSHKWPPEADVFEMFGAPNSRHEGGKGWVHTGTVGAGIPTFNNWHKIAIEEYASFHRYGLLWAPKPWRFILTAG